MKIIRPTTITDSVLSSSSVAENDFPTYSSGAAYAAGDKVIKASTHRIYQSIQASNTNHDPATSPTWWLDIGPTNRWAMFDNAMGSATTATTSLTVTLAPGRIDSLALVGIDAASVSVTMTAGGSTVYSKTASLINDSGVTDWYSYFFDPIKAKDYFVISGLPVMSEATITITISKSSGTVSCQGLVVGMKSDLGDTLISPGIGITDYSRKSTDDFGVTTLIKRAYARKLDCKLIVENTEIDRVVSTLAEVRATPVIWYGSDRYSSLVLFGFYRDFSVDIAYSTMSYCTLNIEGMT